MALIDLLAYSVNQYDDADPEWRAFISDHKQYLIANSTLATISPGYMQRYVFSLKRYLRSNNYNTHFAWIVALINDRPTDTDFSSDVTMLLLPSAAVIEMLYTNYLSAKSLAA